MKLKVCIGIKSKKMVIKVQKKLKGLQIFKKTINLTSKFYEEK